MEGDPEDSDEDVQGEEKPTLLWEKCIQQSIIVDLSEDESLHLSDLENSLAFHLSQAESAASEASIHLSGSAELSGLDDTSSESSSVNSHSVNVVESKSSILHISAQRPNTMLDEVHLNQVYEDPGQDTSDEDQEDLPYDGDLGSQYFNQTPSTEGNTSSDGQHTVQASPDLLDLPREVADTNFFGVLNPGESVLPLCTGPADITQMLLRHFSQEKLLQSGRLIEAETLPEVSLLESTDNTLYSLALTQHSTGNNDTKGTRSLEENTEKKSDPSTSPPGDNSVPSSASTGSNQSSEDVSEDGVQLETSEEHGQIQRVPLVRARSFTEIKYGQGKVHYPLPDFSKVAPKVKIPKAPSGPVRSVPHSSSSMHRTQSSPGMLDVISRVLEDSVQPPEKPYVFKDEDKQTPPALVDHLQAEYDKLLTKYAEAENLIDQMRIGTNTQPSSDMMLYLEHDGDDDEDNQVELVEGNHLGFQAPQLPSSENVKENGETILNQITKEEKTTSLCQPEDVPSDGERMTAELRDIIGHFMQKVEELRFSVSNMTVSTMDQQMMLRGMMEAQDQLERRYISKKEEHRALEMQNYMGLCRNTGTFDPDRLVEGDIFRIGMHLEDIKEMIDQHVCEQISPPHSSSTPTAMGLHVKPGPQSMSTPSPTPSLHEWQSAVYSIASYQRETQQDDEEEEEEEEEEASEVHVRCGLDQSSDIVVTEHLLNNTGLNSCQSRDLLGSLEIQTAEEEDGNTEERSSVLSGVIDHSDILAYLSGTKQWTDNSCSTPDSVPHPTGEFSLGDCVSLTVEVSSSSDTHRDSDSLSEPPLNTSSVSQRIVSPETDSGFGSSYLNQSASGSSHPNLLSESVLSQNEGLSSSDSEGSCSNLQTAIHSAEHHCASPQTRHSVAAATVEQWVESTTKEPSVRLQDTNQNQPVLLQHHISQPVVSNTMNTEGRGSPLQSCSCNSEAILALQSEVSRLKKDLEEGLVQLPHLAQKMDYLTSKYRHERQGRRSKTRTHQRPACNSVGKSLSNRGVSNVTSSQVRIEDWISSDMDPSKSKGTGSGDTICSEITPQFHSSPVGSRRGGGSVSSAAEFQCKLQQTVQSKGVVGSSSFKGDRAAKSQIIQTQQTMTKSLLSKDKWDFLHPSPSIQKPLLQVSYGSSSSLPASYKVKEPPLQSYHRKRSTQSDTALLPSNVYFQQTLSTESRAPSRTGGRTGKHSKSKEEDMNRTLDQAIEVALSMKRTTDRIARRLSADLAKAQQCRKLHNMQPLGGRKHQAL